MKITTNENYWEFSFSTSFKNEWTHKLHAVTYTVLIMQ